MSKVAEGHFRGKREARLILRGSTSQFRGPSPDLSPATNSCTFRLRTWLPSLLIRSSKSGHLDPFKSVRTSVVSLPVVHASPAHREVIRPCDSQRGSRTTVTVPLSFPDRRRGGRRPGATPGVGVCPLSSFFSCSSPPPPHPRHIRSHKIPLLSSEIGSCRREVLRNGKRVSWLLKIAKIRCYMKVAVARRAQQLGGGVH